MKKLLFGPFQLDPVKRVVTGSNDETLDLTSLEFDILELLVTNAGNVISREIFHERIWGQPNVGATTLTTHISAVRRKLCAAHSPAQSYIQAVQTKGYRFCEQVTYSEDPRSAIETATAEPAPERPVGEPDLQSPNSEQLPETSSAEGVSLSAGALHFQETVQPPSIWESANNWLRRVPLPKILAVLFLLAVAATMVRALFRTQTFEIRSFRRLTFDGETKTGPLVFDGQRVYFRLDSEENPDTKFVDLSDLTVDPVRFSRSKTYVDGYCKVSKALLVYNDNNRTLSLFKAAGGKVNPLLTMPGLSGGAISQDCKYVAYGGDKFIGIAQLEGDKIDSPISGKKFDLPGMAIYPHWRPDDSVVRFCLVNPVTTENTLWELGPRTASQPVRVENAPDGICDGAWTRDGRVYVAANLSQKPGGELWSFEDSLLRGTVARAVGGGTISWHSPVSDPSSNRLFAIGRASKFELSELEPGTGAIKPYLGGISATDLGFSPDAKKIVFTKYPDWQIWIANADGSHPRRITGDFKEAHMAHFSPDGWQIAFMAKRNGLWRIFVTVAAAQAMPVLDAGPDQGVPTWLSDHQLIFGDFLQHNAHDGQMSIHVLDLASKPPKLSDLPNSYGFWTPRVSPDRKRLIALSYDLTSLAEYDFTSRQWRAIGQARALENPAWATPDSVYVYGLDDSGERAVFRANLSPESGGLHKVVLLDASQVIPSPSFTATPDNRILFLHRITIDDIYELIYSMD